MPITLGFLVRAQQSVLWDEGPAQASAGNSRPKYFDNRIDYQFLPVVFVRFEGSAINFGWVLAPGGTVHVDS